MNAAVAAARSSCSGVRPSGVRMSSSTTTASSMWAPLLSMTHSARSPIAASLISAREGSPLLAAVRAPGSPRSPAGAPPRTATGSPPATRPAARSRPRRRGHRARSSRRLRVGASPSSSSCGKALECASGLDLEHHADAVGAQLPRVSRAAAATSDRVLHKGHLDDVGDFDDRGQVLDVLVGQRRYGQRGVRQVDALGCAQIADRTRPRARSEPRLRRGRPRRCGRRCGRRRRRSSRRRARCANTSGSVHPIRKAPSGSGGTGEQSRTTVNASPGRSRRLCSCSGSSPTSVASSTAFHANDRAGLPDMRSCRCCRRSLRRTPRPRSTTASRRGCRKT